MPGQNAAEDAEALQDVELAVLPPREQDENHSVGPQQEVDWGEGPVTRTCDVFIYDEADEDPLGSDVRPSWYSFVRGQITNLTTSRQRLNEALQVRIPVRRLRAEAGQANDSLAHRSGRHRGLVGCA